ncbi:MAG: hypothetical protein MRY21_06615 [Simkaniaceae bacterium]|nr:hypothetical protein [Simkaniaceae bacterium]
MIFFLLLWSTLFGGQSVCYFHTRYATLETLEKAREQNAIYEFDLAWAHRKFHPLVTAGAPYIGHPEEFYTIENHPFLKENLSFQALREYLVAHPDLRVLIDIKDELVIPYVAALAREIGKERCLVHAFIREWQPPAEVLKAQAHWVKEAISLKKIEALAIPFIANCHAVSREYTESANLLEMMLKSASECKSLIALGLYFEDISLPALSTLKAINDAGYYAWVNGNLPNIKEQLKEIDYYAMVDEFSLVKN